MTDITAAPAYLRKSRAEEGEEISSVLSRHRASLMETAHRLGIEISEYYEEVVSGESLSARPEMLRLLADIESGRHSAVLCMDIDRLGRGGMSDQGAILDVLRAANARIITPDKIYDLSNDDDEEMTEFKAFFARREYKMIRKRMHRGLIRTIEEGGYVANAPYGYRSVRVGKLPSLEVVPEEAEIIRYMFVRYLEGVGSHIIAQEINAMGSKPRRSAAWSRSSVRAVLKNPTYYGAVPWNRVRWTAKDGRRVSKQLPPNEWVLAKGIHKPLITQEEFERAQAIRTARGTTLARYTGEIRNPLAGMLFCVSCGCGLQRMGEHKGEPYIRCNTAGCSAGAKAALVEAALLRSVEADFGDVKLKQRTGERDISGLELMEAGLKKKLDGAEVRRARLFEFLEDGTYTRDEFLERRTRLEEELRDISSRLAECGERRERAVREQRERRALSFERFSDKYRSENARGRNSILKVIVKAAYYTKPPKTKPGAFSLDILYRE